MEIAASDPQSGMIVSFTGHRPDKVGGYGVSPIQDWVRAQLREHLRSLKPMGAISGMALGVDQWAARECIYLGIPFVAAIPFQGQESIWPKASKEEYEYLLSKAHSRTYVCPPGYDPKKMQIRNEWMVDRCGILIAVWNGSSGGTANCVRYAEKKGCRIIRINPLEFK